MPYIRFAEPAFYKIIKQSFHASVKRLISPKPERLTERQQIDFDSLILRGLESRDSRGSLNSKKDHNKIDEFFDFRPMNAKENDSHSSSKSSSGTKSKTDDEELTTLDYFLASSLNVELVYIILKCIT